MSKTQTEASKEEITAYAEVADVFQRLEIQLNWCWLAASDKQEELFEANQNITILKAIENFVLDVQFNNFPDIHQYEEYEKNKNAKGLSQFQLYFDRLRFNQENIPSEIFSKKAAIFFNACTQFNTATQHLNNPQKSNPLLGMPARTLFDNIPINLSKDSTQLSELIDKIKSQTDSLTTKAKIRASRLQATKNLSDAKEYVEACFKVSPQLFIICMDLGYPSQGKQPGLINPAPINYPQIQSHWSALVSHLSNVNDIVGHFEKLEYTQQRGYSLHATFLCFPQKKYSENGWATRIGDHWMHVTQGLGAAYHNCNPEVRRVSDHAVGLIKAKEKTKREALRRWVISYSTLSSLYIRVPNLPSHTFNIGKQPQAPIPVNPVLTKAESNKQVDSAFILTPKQTEQAWKIPKANLAPQVITQLKELTIIYHEIGALFHSHQPFPIQPSPLASIPPALLIQIETFMVYARESNIPAFNTSPFWGGAPTDKDALQWRTRLGTQLIDLYSRFDVNYFLASYEYLSPSVRIFCAVANNHSNWMKEGQRPFDGPPSSRMHFFNHFIREVRERLQDDYQMWWRGSLSTQSRLNGKDPRSSKRPQSIRALMTEQFKAANNALEDALDYVGELFKKDVVLISLKLYINFGIQDVPQKVFAELFTTFMRYGKNCHPLAWCLGYIGRWEHVANGQRCARVIFFMHGDFAADEVNTTQQIKEYWGKIVREKGADVGRTMQPPALNLIGVAQENSISLVHDAFYGYSSRIESSDKTKQKIFKQQILVYLVKSNLYHQPNLSELPKALIKAHLSTAKLNIRKNWRPPRTAHSNSIPTLTHPAMPNALPESASLLAEGNSELPAALEFSADRAIDVAHSNEGSDSPDTALSQASEVLDEESSSTNPQPVRDYEKSACVKAQALLDNGTPPLSDVPVEQDSPRNELLPELDNRASLVETNLSGIETPLQPVVLPQQESQTDGVLPKVETPLRIVEDSSSIELAPAVDELCEPDHQNTENVSTELDAITTSPATPNNGPEMNSASLLSQARPSHRSYTIPKGLRSTEVSKKKDKK